MTAAVSLGRPNKDGLGIGRFVCYFFRTVGRHRGVAAPSGELNLPRSLNGIAFTNTVESAASSSQRPTIQHRRLMWKSHA